MTPDQAKTIMALLKKTSIPFFTAKEAVELEFALHQISTGQKLVVDAPPAENPNAGSKPKEN